MAILEILFDPRPGPQQGWALGFAELGLHVTSADWTAFLIDETVLPAGYLERVTAKKHLEFLTLREKINTTSAALTDEQRRQVVWGNPPPTEPERLDQIRIQDEIGLDAMSSDTIIQTNGVDTNWNVQTLTVFGVLVTELTAQEVSEFFEEQTDPTVHALQPRKNAFVSFRKRVVDVAALEAEKATMELQGGLKWAFRMFRSVVPGYTELDAADELAAILGTATYTPPSRDYIPIQFSDLNSAGNSWHKLA